MDPATWVDIGGKIVMGNLVGFFVMALIAWRLWRMMEENSRALKSELAAWKAELATCNAQHLECQRQNFMLAQASINQSNNQPHEARARAQTVIDSIAIASSTPIVTGPGPTTEAVVQAASAPKS